MEADRHCVHDGCRDDRADYKSPEGRALHFRFGSIANIARINRALAVEHGANEVPALVKEVVDHRRQMQRDHP
ncbi:hypothetical protein [Bradyrhizobium sp. LA6.10]|uniref:hypothetical protein n=1 Tax=Bradyrhizobium sp. LA6.10 TaxID=3156318 RepID=UPI0033978430